MRALFMLLAIVAVAALPASADMQKDAASQKSATTARTAKPAGPGVVVNLNTATQAQLETLPGVGPRAAERILEYRQKAGPFKKVEDLMNVKGIGEKSFLKLKPLLTVSDKAATSGDSGR
jgi:competence protein ComEA